MIADPEMDLNTIEEIEDFYIKVIKHRPLRRIKKRVPCAHAPAPYLNDITEDEDGEAEASIEDDNMLFPWTPDTNIWADYDQADGDVMDWGDSSESSPDDDVDSEGEGGGAGRKAISGSYYYRFRQSDGESDIEAEDIDVDQDGRCFIPELNMMAFKITPEQICSKKAREIMKSQVLRDHFRDMQEFRRPKGSYLRCPEGGNYAPNRWKRRSNPGHFLTCPVPHTQCALFEGFKVRRNIRVST